MFEGSSSLVKPQGTLEWLVGGRESSGTLRVGSRDIDEYESQPKRLAVWLPLVDDKGYADRSSGEMIPELRYTPPLSRQEESIAHSSRFHQGPGTLFVPGVVIAENVRHMFVRAEWLSAQAERLIKDTTAVSSPTSGRKLSWSCSENDSSPDGIILSEEYSIGNI